MERSGVFSSTRTSSARGSQAAEVSLPADKRSIKMTIRLTDFQARYRRMMKGLPESTCRVIVLVVQHTVVRRDQTTLSNQRHQASHLVLLLVFVFVNSNTQSII